MQCKSSKCLDCHQCHHSLLHFNKIPGDNNSHEAISVAEQDNAESINLHSCAKSETLLATALVELQGSSNKSKICRVLLDAGSEAHFSIESMADSLNLKKENVNISVTGLDKNCTTIKYATSATLKSRVSNFRKNIKFFMLPKISSFTPSIQLDIKNLDLPKNITLADPKFFESFEVDALLGVKLFYKLLCIGQIALKRQPDAILQKTQLGWIIAGEINNNPSHSIASFHIAITNQSLKNSIKKFWELEEVLSQKAWSKEELACEGYFKTHIRRNHQGRYIVRLPFNEKKKLLGESYNMAQLESIRIDRYVSSTNSTNIQLHGFCDASERAYGACIYIRSFDKLGVTKVKLVCSKSRVAPIKSISLPCLELCGALLLSRLYIKTKDALSMSVDEVHFWCDSTITLHWLKTQPYKLKSFVSNRVAEVQENTSNCYWHHVPSECNTADSISRGQTPAEFILNEEWFNGPKFLYNNSKLWPQEFPRCESLLEFKINDRSFVSCMKIEVNSYDLLEKYSSINKLKRVIAYVMRFIYNAHKGNRLLTGNLSLFELKNANISMLKLVQDNAFSKEISILKRNKALPPSSPLKLLALFLGEDRIIRVGGRLQNSELPYSQIHQILLPAKHHITKLVIRHEHLRLAHAGAQATLYSVRQNYWPLNGRNVTREVIHRCISCFRAKPRMVNHSTGNLPSYRLVVSRPFLRVGVDFCGPIYIKKKRFRNRNRLKVYVAIFICMSSKAVHLELVSDLSTEAFIASLKRFMPRRGKSEKIFSDNVTNFVGSQRHITELYDLVLNSDNNMKLRHYVDSERISWHFIPPRSPHFGGLWEAAVKSFKVHFVRTVGDTVLTYDQLETYMIEIEAILNSRPISPMSEDPNDPLPSTPAHFLIGDSLNSYPQKCFTEVPANRLSAWQHAQKLKQHFWMRWRKEYVHNLISSRSNRDAMANIKIGDLVLIQGENLPPLKWSVGRVITVHPGANQIVRVATVKTMHATYKRAVKKLCILPIG